MNQKLIKPLIVGVIAALVVLIDYYLAPVMHPEGNFVWIVFLSWVAFFGSSTDDRIRAFFGYISGFLFALGMINFTTILNGIIGIYIICAVISVFIFNVILMLFENLRKYYLNSISGIIVGILLVFSGLGVSLSPDGFTNTAIMLAIILVYSTLGLLAGHFTNYFVKKFKKN